MKIRAVGAQLFHEDRRTETTTFFFRIFVKAPKERGKRYQ